MSPSPRYKSLFSPGTIGPLTVKNRVAMAPMVTQYASDTGAVTPTYKAYLEERARGGVGLIVVEATYVDPMGKAFACQLGIDRDGLIPGHVELTEAVHRHGAKIAIQLYHGGAGADPRLTGGNVIAPSAVATSGATPREMTRDEIGTVVRRFAEAADRAKRAGYDAVEIDGAHGYLPQQFLSSITNRRTDDYGGSLKNRLRFSLELIRAVREAVGPAFAVTYRFSAEGGYGLEDAVEFSRAWEAAGLDALHVSIGGIAPTSVVNPDASPMALPQGYLIGHAATIKKALRIPTIAVGVIRDPAYADEVLAQGKADYVALGRQLLCDPFWPAKAAEGREAEILRCISCGHCNRGLRTTTPIRCMINPRLGREGWLGEPTPVARPRKVMIVGGGPAGLEAARVAAARGHHVSLHEATPELGAGQLALAQVPPAKEKLAWLREYLVGQVKRLPVEVHLGSRVDAATVEKETPDVLVLATGASQAVPAIPGIESVKAITSHELLASKPPLRGKAVVVLGGGRIGCETAEYLARLGNKVVVASRGPTSQLGYDIPDTHRRPLLRRLQRAGVEFIVDYDATSVSRGSVTLVGPGGKKRDVDCDLLVIARGATSNQALAQQVADKVPELHIIGDALEPRSLTEAIYEANLVARQI